MKRLKTADLPAVRKELLERQKFICPITGRNLRGVNPLHLCVDHCHTSGVVRAVLPRGINGLEGKIKVLLQRFGGLRAEDVVGQAKLLHGLADYLLLHRVPQTEFIHPNHKTDVEKRAARNALARKRYAMSKEY